MDVSKNSMTTKVKGFLLDLDGVLIADGNAIPGAVEVIKDLRDRGRSFRIVTNATRSNRAQILRRLADTGFTLDSKDLFTAPYAAAEWLRSNGKSCWILGAEGLVEDFEGVEITDKDPDCVVMGDLGENFTYEGLNKAFSLVMGGAELLALQKNRYWERGGELRMDLGGFVAAVEYATGRSARVMGKPSLDYFRLAATGLRLGFHELAMIGDDIHVDIAGAQKVGMQGILVKTGKFRPDLLADSGVTPDGFLGSIAELSSLL